MQDRMDARQDGCRTRRMQYSKNAGQMQYSSDAGQYGCRTGQMKYRSDAVQVGSRTGQSRTCQMQERTYAVKVRCIIIHPSIITLQ